MRDFYGFWSNFQTVKDFAWLDVYNASSAPGRRVRRLMEAENAKARKAGKLAFVADVRELVRTVRASDTRMAAFLVRHLPCRRCTAPGPPDSAHAIAPSDAALFCSALHDVVAALGDTFGTWTPLRQGCLATPTRGAGCRS